MCRNLIQGSFFSHVLSMEEHHYKSACEICKNYKLLMENSHPPLDSASFFGCIFSCNKAIFGSQPTLLMSVPAALGEEYSQNVYRFGNVILLRISACCRLRDLVSEYITPFLHSTLYSQVIVILVILIIIWSCDKQSLWNLLWNIVLTVSD